MNVPRLLRSSILVEVNRLAKSTVAMGRGRRG